ncbi:ferric reductase-like transmembrane domain-containing protein [Paenibacillus caui]|uniref:ferric reductase-like transmembrane domain-containing protein n=1 Tax=Paenibacillus caui TaxID=2873927 RepID=UPI001CA979A1|nr:ferric reductase-like transmembrane domain-containing protein [Paenibacillus caui]
MEHKHKPLKWITVIALIMIYAIFIEMVRRSGSPLSTVPTWVITRTLGITAYLLLFLGICLGITYGMPIWKGKQKIRSRVRDFHFLTNTGGVFLAMLHPMLLVIDAYVPFSWGQLIVPFTGPKEPFIYGLGTLTLYGLLFVVTTTDLRAKMSVKLWRAIHLSAYILFIFALAHGMMGGTDTRKIWIFSMYVVTFCTVLALMIAQVTMISSLKKRAQHGQHVREKNSMRFHS